MYFNGTWGLTSLFKSGRCQWDGIMSLLQFILFLGFIFTVPPHFPLRVGITLLTPLPLDMKLCTFSNPLEIRLNWNPEDGVLMRHVNPQLIIGANKANLLRIERAQRAVLKVISLKPCREAMVNHLNVALQAVSDWGDVNLVTLNATKTQAPAVFHKTESNTPGSKLPRFVCTIDRQPRWLYLSSPSTDCS